ncbi:hypothetical protein E3P99_00933 [Wallemia hederae]|uniref:Protein kinase domain-containing protein n=1 Tax=Wallemia hederae TaxID=1540922 RepID=A0A4T0FT28_9BASI|nr:hypothetical protein E3P99_00933 [Wallemia hederae]
MNSHKPSPRKPLAPTQLSKPPPAATSTLKPTNGDQQHPETIGPWQLLKTIGKGSSACRVKLARHRKTHQQAAIKIVAKASLAPKQNSSHDDPWRALRAIEREIAVMKIIDHPNITSLYDVWETTDFIYMIMEYASGGELFSHLVERAKKNAARAKPGHPPPSRALPPDEALRLFQQLMYAVSHVHNLALCHRDLKPENVLLAKDGQTIKLADFGMATLAGEDVLVSKRKLKKGRRMLKTSCGSPHYASPEVVQGKPYAGHMADVWSCGVILFALLTGRLPFHDENLHVLLSKVKVGKFEMPHELDGPAHTNARNLLLRMLTSDPSERITMPEILKHPYFTRLPPPIPMQTDSIPAGLLPSTSSQKSRFSYQSDQLTEYNDSLQRFSEEIPNIDDEIFSSIRVLCQTETEDNLRGRLQSKGYTIEKRLYVLLERFRDRRSLEELAHMEAGASDESRAWERNQKTLKQQQQQQPQQTPPSHTAKPVALGERSLNTPSEPQRNQLKGESGSENDAPAVLGEKQRPNAPTPTKARKYEVGEIVNEIHVDENEQTAATHTSQHRPSTDTPISDDTVMRAPSVRTASKRLPLESSTDTLDTKVFKKPNTQIEDSPHLNFPMDTPSSSFAASIAASIGHVDIAAGGLIPVANENFNPPSLSSDRIGRSRFSGASSVSFSRQRSVDSKREHHMDDSPVMPSGESPLRSNIPITNRTLRKKPAPAPLKVDLYEYQKPFQIVLDDESGVESDDSGVSGASSQVPPPRPISKSVSGQMLQLDNDLPPPPPLPPKTAVEGGNGDSKTKKILRAVKSFDTSDKPAHAPPHRKPSIFGLKLGKQEQSQSQTHDDKSFKLNIFSPALFHHGHNHKASQHKEDENVVSPTTQTAFTPAQSAPPYKQEYSDGRESDTGDDLELRRDTLPFVANQQPKRKSSLGNLFRLSRTRSSSIVNPATPQDSPALDDGLKVPENKRWLGGLFQPKTASPLKSTFMSSEKEKKEAMKPVEHIPDDLQPPVNPFKKTVRRTRSVISQLTAHDN